jgi:hypothetical protein
MNRRLALLAGATLAGGSILVAPADATTPTHDPYTSSVGIYVQSYHDDTVGTISCSRGSLKLVHGDGTLFMENSPPKTIICFITVKKPSTN